MRRSPSISASARMRRPSPHAPPSDPAPRKALNQIAIFPRLEASLRGGNIVIKNIGHFVIRTREYGAPGYRLIVNGQWHELPRDLGPGEETEIPAPKAKSVQLVHGLQGATSSSQHRATGGLRSTFVNYAGDVSAVKDVPAVVP